MRTLGRFTTRQDVALAAAALAGGVLMLSVQGYSGWSDDWDPPVWLRLVPLVGLCSTMLVRRTAPRAGLAAATPFAFADLLLGMGIAPAIIYGDVLYAASLYGRPRTAERLLVTTVAASLAVLAGVAAGLGSVSEGIFAGAIAGIVWVGPVLTAMAVREHRSRAEAERQRAEQVARLAEMDRLAAVNAERARMARELHDVVANHLSAVALHSSAVLKRRDLDREEIERAMEVIRENSVRGLAEMRRMIGLLREGRDGADDAADPAARPRLAELEPLVRHSARSDLSARLEVAGEPPELPAAVELAAYRIVQESLTNAMKHAGPGRAEVRVAYTRRAVVIDVSSPLGREGARLPGTGSGLVGMRERAAMLSGSFEAGPDGDRWRVRAELPLDPQAAERVP